MSEAAPGTFQASKVRHKNEGEAGNSSSQPQRSSRDCYASFGQLGPHAESTAHFVQKANNLFDVLNSSRKFKALLTVDSPLLSFLDECVPWMKSWRIINRKGQDCTHSFRFIDGFLINIQSIKGLLLELKEEKFEYLLTRRLCTDPHENLFCILRSGRGFELTPSCEGFAQAFKRVVMN